MKIKSFFIILVVVLFVYNLSACKEKQTKQVLPQQHTKFDIGKLLIKEDYSTRKVQGQILYLPTYSNIPNPEMGGMYDISAFIAIHNTDFANTVRITKVLFFDNDGKLISNYLQKDTVLHPLGTASYYLPTNDRSGTGANFIVEWIADSLVTEPLIESVMVGFTSGQGVSFISTGRIIREIK